MANPGREGTLALSDAAPALDLLRAEVGMFRVWRFQWFTSILDPGSQTYLAGHRMEWSPTPRLTVGVTEMARFDGTSQAPLYLIPFVPYSFWEKRPKSTTVGAIPGDSTGVAFSKNNVLQSVDASWTPRRGWRLWGEFMLDDISFSNTEELTSPVVTDIASGTNFTFSPTAVVDYALDARAQVYGQYYLEWGPIKRITAIVAAVPTLQFSGTPSVSGNQVQIDFNVTNYRDGMTFLLLNASDPGGTWTTNSSAVIQTNLANSSFRVTTSTGGASKMFYRVQSN